MYLVAKDGKFFALTTEKSVNLNGEKGSFTVRAANQMGGFGATANSVSTGIHNIASATDAAVIKTTIYRSRRHPALKSSEGYQHHCEDPGRWQQEDKQGHRKVKKQRPKVIRLTDNIRSAISSSSFRRVPDIALFLFPQLLKQQKRELRKQTVEM